MARKILTNLDLSNNQLLNAVLQVLATDPASPTPGLHWYNSTDGTFRFRQASATAILGRLDQITPPTASLNLNSQKIVSLLDPTAAQDGATKAYVDGRRLDQISAPTASVGLNSQKITSLLDPTAAQDAATKAYVDARRLDQLVAPTADVAFNTRKITGLGDPTAAQDGATKNYVDNLLSGLAWKDEVRVASVGNVTVSSPGAAIDGVTMVAGDRVLLKNQTTGAENGIYVWNGAATPMTRSTDADTSADILQAAVFVMEGTGADTGWVNSTNAPITLGTTALTFVQFTGSGALSGGNGLTLTGNTLAVGAGTGITVNADDVALTVPVSIANGGTGAITAAAARTALGTMSRFAASVGNGSLTTIPVAHNLGTRDVVVNVYDNTTYEEVMPDVVRTDVNTVNLIFSVAPTTNQYRCVVMG